MRLRSLLFVPGDRPDRMEKALRSDADALILDLEDAVALAAKEAARRDVAAFLTFHADRPVPILVRVNPLDSPLIDDDLAALAPARPNGLVLPKATGAASVRGLSARMPEIPILPIATEIPEGIFALGSYREVGASLLGLTWGAEDLPAAIGASTSREPDGAYTPPYELARSLTLFGAHAARVPAIETVYPGFRDEEGLRNYVARAARDGFTGMMAIHPAQLPIINAGFTPDASQIARARQVIAAFRDKPQAGAIQLDGMMLDAPHLAQAFSILRRAGDLDD